MYSTIVCMSFPPKKLPEQRLSGYIADNLTLIEGYLNSSVGASAVIRLIFESTGLKVSLPVFHNALYRARKKTMAQTPRVPSVSQQHQPLGSVALTPSQKPNTPASTDPRALQAIMSKQIDLSKYPRTFTGKVT
jgi:hypothetical protein